MGEPIDYGMTSPLLNIARAFQDDYVAVLLYADYLIHKRQRDISVWLGHPVRSAACAAAIEDHANKFNRLRHGLDATRETMSEP